MLLFLLKPLVEHCCLHVFITTRFLHCYVSGWVHICYLPVSYRFSFVVTSIFTSIFLVVTEPNSCLFWRLVISCSSLIDQHTYMQGWGQILSKGFKSKSFCFFQIQILLFFKGFKSNTNPFSQKDLKFITVYYDSHNANCYSLDCLPGYDLEYV